jgi:hypothetical protein
MIGKVVSAFFLLVLICCVSLVAQDATPAQNPQPATGAEAAAPAAAAPTATTAEAATAPASTPAVAPGKLLLREGEEVKLKFVDDLSSKTAEDGDSVNFVLDEPIKVGDVVVVKEGAKAVGTVTNAKKAGMMGRAGELNIRLEHLKSGDDRIRLRGSKGKEGEGKEGTAVALTVLFGPIGLIKHGKNVEVKAGTPLTAYVDQDIALAPAQ